MKAAAILILASLCALPAFADDNAGTGGGGHNGACKADVEKLCPGIQPGGGRIMACLREHKDEISDACKTNMARMRARHQAGGGTESGNAGTDNGGGDDK